MFTVLKDNGSITDISINAKDFITNYVPLSLLASDYLYVGHYKPFKQFFIELGPFNTEAGSMKFEYWNGTTWQVLPVVDETNNFNKSGFITFEKPEAWVANEVDSKENFYIRMQPSAPHSLDVELRGLGILFSNDLDLIGVKSNIVSKLNNGESWVGKHEDARKFIIQRLRNLGNRKYTEKNSVITEGTYFSDLTEFDILEIDEVRQASKYFTLSMIYLDELSDEQDDKYERAGLRHRASAEESINLFMLKLDTNDDGLEDKVENSGNTGINLTWV